MLSTKNLPIVTKKKMMMMLVLVLMRIARRRHILALLHCDSCSVVTRVVPVLVLVLVLRVVDKRFLAPRGQRSWFGIHRWLQDLEGEALCCDLSSFLLYLTSLTT